MKLVIISAVLGCKNKVSIPFSCTPAYLCICISSEMRGARPWALPYPLNNFSEALSELLVALQSPQVVGPL